MEEDRAGYGIGTGGKLDSASPVKKMDYDLDGTKNRGINGSLLRRFDVDVNGSRWVEWLYCLSILVVIVLLIPFCLECTCSSRAYNHSKLPFRAVFHVFNGSTR